MNPTVKRIKDDLPTHFSDLEWLSISLLELAAANIDLSSDMGAAHLTEAAKGVSYLAQLPTETEKKMSVAESEKRAIVDTLNRYEVKKLEQSAVIEFMNVLKKRQEILILGYKNP